MAYLSKPDYTLRVSVVHLDEILAQAIETSGLTADQVRTNAESWAQAMINSYLSSRYDMVAEFALTGASRNFLIMQAMIDLTLCTIHKTINPRDVPEHISKACEDVMQWLKDARDGVIVSGLALKPATAPDVNYQRTYINSQTKFISKPYSDASLQDETAP